MTKKTNVIIPEIMGPAIGARLDKALRLMPYAKIDSTLENNEGDEVTIPVWEYSGDAVDVAEGEEVETSQLNATTRKYKVKKAMKAFPITDEAQMSAHGGVGEEAESQLVKSIKGKIDNDLINECYGETVKTIELSGALDYTGIVKGVAAFGFESNPAKVLFINPAQEASMLLNPYFKDRSKFNAPVGIDGVIGMIAGCYVKKSKKVRYVEPTTEHGGYWLNPIVIIDDEQVEDEDPTPALTIFVKKEFRLEVSRDTLSQVSSLIGSKHYLAALTNASKVVVVKSVVADPTSYTLSYNGNGGEGSVESQEGVTLTVAQNGFTKTDYAFSAWNTKADGSGTSYAPGASITLSADTTLYAIWELITYTLSYDANGGTGTMSEQEGVELTVASNAFTKEGYSFVKWNTSSDGSGTDYDPSDSITLSADVTLYAIWAQVAYTLSYDANNGTGTMSPETGVEVTVAANGFTREHYSFVEWNTAADGTGTAYDPNDSITLSADMTLYAIWEMITHTVTFDANGGTGTMAAMTVNDGESATLTTNAFTKSGYTFSKWNTASDGSGTDYTDGGTITPSADVTLYAVWEEESMFELSGTQIKVKNNYRYALRGAVELPATLNGTTITGVANQGFENCVNMTSVVMPSGYTYIGSQAFNNCNNLTSATIPNGVTTLDSGAFAGTSLASITIPSSVTQMATSVFANCASLTNITVEATTPPTLQSYAFHNVPAAATIIVPYSADHSVLNAYKAATNWAARATYMVEASPYIGSWTDPNFSAGGGDPYMLTVVADQDYWQPQMSIDNGATFEALQAKTAYTLNQDGSLDVVIVSLGNVQAHIELVNGSLQMSVSGNVISTMTKDSTTKPFLPYSN